MSANTIKNSNENIEQLFWADIAKIGDSVIKSRGDQNGISKDALAKALDEGKLAPEQEMVAGALYRSFDNIASASPLPAVASKITNTAFRKFTEQSARVDKEFGQADKLTYWADDQGNLKKIASDKNGAATIADVDQALRSKTSSAEDLARLAELKANFASIARNGKIGRSEIDQYWTLKQTAPGYSNMAKFYHSLRAIEANQSNLTAHKLFSFERDPAKSIQLDAVEQGYAGDCSFYAALGSLTKARPQDVLSMIKKDGSQMQIQFPVLKKEIALTAPASYELGLYFSEKNKFGNWPFVMTKAYGQYVFSKANPIEKMKMEKLTRAQWAGEDGSISKAMETLTGHDAKTVLTKELSNKELENTIVKAANENRIIVLGSPNGNNKTADGYKPGHAFSVIGVSKDKLNNLLVTVRDPGNKGINNPRGISTVSIEKIRRNFDILCEETDRQQVVAR